MRSYLHTGALCLGALLAAPTLARAGAWIPVSGSGEAEIMLRGSFADRSFPADSFSSTTHASSTEHKVQLRIRGEHGLGNGFSLEYDLRYGFLYRSKLKKHQLLVDTNDGLQDQRIGISYALTRKADFADAIGMSVVIPGSSAAKIPGLDSGHWALEPVYCIGFKPGFWHLTANLDAGSRIFTDGGVAQFRTHLELGAPVLHHLRLAGKLLFVRSARLAGFDYQRDHGELYNVLRAGVEAKYRVAAGIEPFLAYEYYLAGMGGHAHQRLAIGVKLKY
jgi:hypothetical protein